MRQRLQARHSTMLHGRTSRWRHQLMVYSMRLAEQPGAALSGNVAVRCSRRWLRRERASVSNWRDNFAFDSAS